MGHKTNALAKLFGILAIPTAIALAGINHITGKYEDASDALSGKTTEEVTTHELQPYQEPEQQ